MDNLSLNNPVQANPIQEKIRNSSLELLRIIAMVMIVFHHFAIHTKSHFAIPSITGCLFARLIFCGAIYHIDMLSLHLHSLLDSDSEFSRSIA